MIDEATVWCTSRRALLAGLGGAGAAGLLAACGDDAVSSPPGAAKSATSAGSPSASAGDGALADTADVPVGGGTVVGSLLIVQPVAGTFKAYDAACPHKGVKVNPPKDGIATCPAHASTFSIADGARLAGPATRGLTAVAVVVKGTKIVRQ